MGATTSKRRSQSVQQAPTEIVRVVQQPQQPQPETRKRTLSEVIEGQYPGMMAQQRQKVAEMSEQQRRVAARDLGLH
jgi:hypothetical protein